MSEVSQAEKDEHHMVSLICDILKNGKNKLIYKTESQMYKTNMIIRRQARSDKLGDWDGHIHTTISKIDN